MTKDVISFLLRRGDWVTVLTRQNVFEGQFEAWHLGADPDRTTEPENRGDGEKQPMHSPLDHVTSRQGMRAFLQAYKQLLF